LILVWLAVVATGLVVTVGASRYAVRHAMAAAAVLEAPPFLLGVTLLAIGTDLPEMANSVIASISGHGDVNVGDSVGSAAAQSTIIIGLLPWITRRSIPVAHRKVALTGGLAVVALGLGMFLVADGDLSRLDGGLLLSAWIASMWLLARNSAPPEPVEVTHPKRAPLLHGLQAVLGLILVTAGALSAVHGLVNLAEALEAPEYLISFLTLALGTSLPELALTTTAVRKGQADLALGNALGASLIDATLSIGIGPLIAPTLVTASLAVRGGLFAAIAVALATTTLVVVKRLGRLAGAWLVVIYVAASVALIAF
jgi:cation:H+ antiporter